ncbi:MAG: ATP-dependent zinc metalloprotease FtsH [Eubacterium sp.]|nr:ATP-dependent zinc metalloprotease FtsH [Eubacterium sp.]
MRKNLSQNFKSAIFYILIPILLIGSVFLFTSGKNNTEMNYSEVVDLFRTNQVSQFEIDLGSGSLSYKLFKDKKEDAAKNYSVPSVPYFLDDISEYVKTYNDQHPDNQIKYNYKKASNRSWLTSMLPMALITVGLTFFLIWSIRRMGDNITNETNRTLGFGKLKPKNGNEASDKTFEDVAGCDEEKEELTELVEFLKEPDKYTQLGARIPKGVLLVGPPGTGKTLLAKAVAGEAGAPFLSISGSDFVEMYVGVGASRVRDLFEQAKKKSPAIVFIDEIDAVGRHRGAGMGGGNDEREQTLNQLLVEMDGFGTNSGVIVIAATNRPDVLDPALLRPGRFDRQITVNRPDTKGREDILKVHTKNIPLAPDVDLKEIAKDTIGFTGADLENLMNESALLAVRRGRLAVTMDEVVDATSRVEMGTEKKSHKYNEKTKKLTAFHEAGHAVSSYYIKDHDPVREISIIPRGLGAGGYTWYTPQEEKFDSRKSMQESLVSLFGGRVAEALALDDISIGASNDLQRATEIARDMVAKYGMSDSIGPVVYDNQSGEVFLGRDYGSVKNYSEDTAAKIDAEVEKIMREAYSQTESILKEHFDKLELIANILFEKEKISGEDFVSLMENGYLTEDAPKTEETETVEQPADTQEQAVVTEPITEDLTDAQPPIQNTDNTENNE